MAARRVIVNIVAQEDFCGGSWPLCPPTLAEVAERIEKGNLCLHFRLICIYHLRKFMRYGSLVQSLHNWNELFAM